MSDTPLLKRAWGRLRRTYFEADPRALGLFRIAFGLLCLWDVGRRLPWMSLFYSNDGVLSNHYALFQPHVPYNFTLLSAFSRPEEVAVFFGFTIVVLVLFTLGLFTRVTHVLSMLCVLSIHSRNVLLENGGDVVMNLWWLWTLFLPLGRRFSLDALRASMKTKESPGQLNDRPPPDRTPVVSLAVLAVILQLAVLYALNTVHKSGDTWMDGTAVAWTLEQDRIVTGLGMWARDAWPLGIFQLMTWGTLVIEGLAPLLIMSPVFTTWTRRVAFTSLFALHFGIWLLTDVGLFSPTMVVGYLLLISAADIDLLKRVLRRLAGPGIIVAYDSDCGICHWLARVGARCDRLGLITWLGRDPDGPLPPGYDRERFDAERDETLMAWVPGGERAWLRHRAVGRTIAALPLGRLVAWIFAVPGVSHVLEPAYSAFARRRHLVGAWFGFGVCGMPQFGGPAADDDPPSEARVWLNRLRRWAANGLILALMVACSSQLLVENRFVRETLEIKHQQPAWARRTVQYGRFFQGWSMFAPDAPRVDGWMVIDAELADGTRIDPQTGEAPRFEAVDAERMVPGPFWGSYTSRIARKRNRKYRQEFVKWMRRSRVQRLHLPPGAKVKRFTAWWQPDRSPEPGSGAEPVVGKKWVIARWPAEQAPDG